MARGSGDAVDSKQLKSDAGRVDPNRSHTNFSPKRNCTSSRARRHWAHAHLEGLAAPAQVDPPTRTVVVEVMGRHSNVITINGDGDILSCAYQTGQAQTRVRPLSVGGAYTLPPVADGLQVRCTLHAHPGSRVTQPVGSMSGEADGKRTTDPRP
jgi:hypothetical protein